MVSGSLSVYGGNEEIQNRSPLFTYANKFYEVFPYYLSIGMTYDQYWNGDSTLPIYYRKAEELRNEKRNQELWLQGMYVYEAICDVAPILQAFAKKGTKPRPYTTNPYPITSKELKRIEEGKERKIAEKGKRNMEAFMQMFNKRFETPQTKDK